MDGKNNNWMELDEEGVMPRPIEVNIPEPTLGRVARCPYCGRFMKRGLLNFLEHAAEDCPHHTTYIFSLKEEDVIPLTNNEQ